MKPKRGSRLVSEPEFSPTYRRLVELGYADIWTILLDQHDDHEWLLMEFLVDGTRHSDRAGQLCEIALHAVASELRRANG